MKRSSLPVLLILLSAGGILAFLPLTEEVARKGHQILWAVEAAWFLWGNRPSLSVPRSAVHVKKP